MALCDISSPAFPPKVQLGQVVVVDCYAITSPNYLLVKIERLQPG
jgi:hypothetical protein